MKINAHDWLFLTGKAGAGKTYWERAHAKKIPQRRLFILDYNVSDYQDFKNCNIWNMQSGEPWEVDKFLKIVYQQGNVFTILSEADNYLRNPSPLMTRYVNTARNRGIGCMMDAKRAKSVRPEFRTRFNKLILFKNTLSDDIEYLEAWAGTGRGSLDMLRTLDTGDHIIVDLDAQKISDTQKIR